MPPLKKAILLGSGGHAKALLSVLRPMKLFKIVGALSEESAAPAPDCPILGGDKLLPQLHKQGVTVALLGIGGVGKHRLRKTLFDKAKKAGFSFASIIATSSIVSPDAALGEGVQIFPGAIVNPWAVLGDNVLINTGAIVEHDCVVGDHVHVATGARLASAVKIGAEAHIGVGASVRQLTRIGAGAVIGAGAAVIKDVPAGAVAVGVPARAR